MARLGAFCFPGSGHINPVTALARALELRGHSVVMFGIADTESRIRAAGIEFHQIGASDYPPGTLKSLDDRLGQLSGLGAFRFTLERIANTARMTLRDGPSAVREARIDALLVDEADASGSVADFLGLPWVSVAVVPPMNHDDSVPPFYFGWPADQDWLSRFRNRMGVRLLHRIGRPISDLLNAQRKQWGLKPLKGIRDSLSPLCQVAQMPKALEFESADWPANLHYTGPWVSATQRPPVEFPWDRLDGRTLVYASLGTLQNGSEPVFRTIAAACSNLPVQLVLSLGGGLKPKQVGRLAGDPIVVPFAPQLDLLKKAGVVVTHAGINTVLESLSEGVPMVAIPLGNDQPGVAARLAARGLGVVVANRKLGTSRLRHAVRCVLDDPGYCKRANEFARQIREIDGPSLAAEIIERTLQLSAPLKPLQRFS